MLNFKKTDPYPSGERKRNINWLVIWGFETWYRIKEKGSRKLQSSLLDSRHFQFKEDLSIFPEGTLDDHYSEALASLLPLAKNKIFLWKWGNQVHGRWFIESRRARRIYILNNDLKTQKSWCICFLLLYMIE